MQYREDRSSGNKLSALGLGCMRFSRDKAETERMILAAIDGGVNFFDTAYLYPNSENILGTILNKHDKRKDVYIATKMPLMMCRKTDDFNKFFNEQLKRLQTDHIDYYMLHNISSYAQWENFTALGIKQWIKEKKESGQIRQIGFSYHGTYSDFLKIIYSYPWDFCMIQYNYYDENYQAGKKGLRAAAEKGMSVLIMEPLLGGRLATGLPDDAVKLFEKADPDFKPVEWAFGWLLEQNEVTVVLSGMNSLEQMEENIRIFGNHKPLCEEKSNIYPEVIELFRKSYKIPCTSCDYCLPCPRGINIPGCFSAYNTKHTQGFIAGISLYMNSTAAITMNPTSPRLCNDCGICEKNCPQQIPIRKSLKKVAGSLEPLPIRMLLAIIRRVLAK